MTTHANYQDELLKFVSMTSRQIHNIFSLKPGSLSNEELVFSLEYICGLKIDEIWERTGRISLELLSEIVVLPPEQRTLSAVIKAAKAHEAGLMSNRAVNEVADRQFNYSPILMEHIEQFRKERMRMATKKLALLGCEITVRTGRLLVALRQHRSEPGPKTAQAVKVASKNLKTSLLGAHTQARLGVSWALRAGFSCKSATVCFQRLYVTAMRKLQPKLEKLDDYMASNGIQSDLSEGIGRRLRVLAKELMKAHANDELFSGRIARPKTHNQEVALEI